MLNKCLNLLQDDQIILKQKIQGKKIPNSETESFISFYDKEIHSLILKLEEKKTFSKHFADSSTSNDTLQLFKFDELQKQISELKNEILNKDDFIRQLNKNIDHQDQEYKDLFSHTKNLKESYDQLQLQNDQLHLNIKELTLSRDKLLQDLERLSIERNQLIENLTNEKMKIAETLNEINELNEQLVMRSKSVQDDENRLKNSFRQIQSKDDYVSISPVKSRSSISSPLSGSIPSMVYRKLSKYHSAEIYDIASNLNGSLIATCGGDHYVRVFDPLNLNTITQFSENDNYLFVTMAFSPQNDGLLLGSTSNKVTLYSIPNWKCKSSFYGHNDTITGVGFYGGDKNQCVSTSKDRQIKLWNVNKSQCVKQISTSSMVEALGLFKKSSQIITGHRDGSIRGFNLKDDGKPFFQMPKLSDDAISSITVANDENYMICSTKEGETIKMVDLRMYEVRRHWHKPLLGGPAVQR